MTMTAQVATFPAPLSPVTALPRTFDIALLGLGRVGSAVAALALNPPDTFGVNVRLVGALVRDCERQRDGALHRRVRLHDDASRLLSRRPDLVIEVLGGVEPARTIVLDALERGIPVVTANKSLMAAHGDELLAAAALSGAALRYEASVLAGVPFLGTFGTRPLAARLSRVTGIVNGTSNYILTKMERERQDFADALADAQRLGLAEPNPANDIDGIDAVEKLAVLIRHFSRRSVAPSAIETVGIGSLQALDLQYAREFGGVIKSVVDSEWTAAGVSAFVGPAFVPSAHKLARIDGVENAVCLHGAATGDLFYSGPGAGPAVTAATILDDVAECCSRATDDAASIAQRLDACRFSVCEAPATSWFIRLTGRPTLPHGADLSDLLGSFGIWLRRLSSIDTSTGRPVCYLQTWPASRERVEQALTSLADAARCDFFCVRSLER